MGTRRKTGVEGVRLSELSRRAVIAGTSAATFGAAKPAAALSATPVAAVLTASDEGASPVRAGASEGRAFEAWEADRAEVERLADRTPETEEHLRGRLLDRRFELENLIIATPCLELPAIRVKARLLLWLKELEDGDGLDALRHIHAYLHRKA
jgi:hypothetical protein